MHHGRWEIAQDAECVSRSSRGSCCGRVTQWRCWMDCYWLTETQRETQVNGAWSYFQELSDTAIPGPLPISTPPTQATMQNPEQANENRSRHCQHGDDNRLWGSHPSTISRIVVSSWDTRTMCMYAAKMCQLSHRTCHSNQREFVRKSHSGSWSVGWEWEEITGYPAVRNLTNHVDLRNLEKCEWDQ